jgi:hypothetical protein
LGYYGLSVGVTVIVAFLLFYMADLAEQTQRHSCALHCPTFAPLPLITPILAGAVSPQSTLIYPITIFGNAVIFAALSGVYIIARNIVWHKKRK